MAVSFDYDRICAAPGCDVKFTPPGVAVKYCPDHRGKRNRRITTEMVCAAPDCDEKFIPKRASQKYHSKACAHRATNHRALNTRRAAARQKAACVICGRPFTAADRRQQRCDNCAEIHVIADNANGRGITVTQKIPASGKLPQTRDITFCAVDGEGITGQCLECPCPQYTPDGNTGTCQCGHPEISPPAAYGRGHDHKYVLLGCGDAQIAKPEGLNWEDCAEFLYSQYNPDTIYVGFFLGYDFTMMLRTLPPSKAWQLFDKSGQEKRKYRNSNGRGNYHKVKVTGKRGTWEFHLHADRRLEIRPKICGCPGDTHLPKSERGGKPCPVAPTMYICDAGGFFQTAFLNVIDPSKWTRPVVTAEEYETIRAGKERRSTARLDDSMRYYNRLENKILARVMDELGTGFRTAGIELSKRDYYGPGQAAAAWLRQVRGIDRETITRAVPAHILDAAQKTYFGGWFEIMAHGIIPGTTWEYDINSAYPSVITTLPCLLHGRWETTKPRNSRSSLPPLADGDYRIIRAAVWGDNPYIGTMLHRNRDGSIVRPTATLGWYWQSELEAAQRCGLIKAVQCIEWHTYHPCDCKPPLRGVRELYDERLRIGKNTPQGKAYKVVYNSMYGKFAQSIGNPPYANPVYASLITSGCRTMILDAIATHPQGAEAVVMVATDGVYFTSPHPGLPLSEKLGEWEESQHSNLTLFKPGVYWDDKAREMIARGDSPVFKARGVSARDFAQAIPGIDRQFQSWNGTLPLRKSDWPQHTFRLGFSMITCKQALRWTEGKRRDPGDKTGDYAYWRLAGKVSEVHVTHSSYPGEKRGFAEHDGLGNPVTGSRSIAGYDGRIYRSRPLDGKTNEFGIPEVSVPYDGTIGRTALVENSHVNPEEWGITPDGMVWDHLRDALGVG